MRLLLSTAIAALLAATSASAQVQGAARLPQAVGQLQAAPPQQPFPVSYGPAQCVLSAFTPAQGWRPIRHPRFFADVNADNRDDIVGFADDGVWVALSTGAGFQDPARWTIDFGSNSGWRADTHERLLADVNGDRRADIVGFGNEGTYVALSTGSSFGATSRWAEDFGLQQGWRKIGLMSVDENDNTVSIAAHHPRMMADINNNGAADIIGFGNTGTFFAISTGNRFTGTRLAVQDLGYEQGWSQWATATSADAPPTLSNRIRTMADVNGDGSADIVGIQRNGAIAAFGNANGGFDLAPFFVIDGMGTDSGWRNTQTHPRMLVDLNGDGRTDFVGFGDDGVWTALARGRTSMTPPAFTLAAFGRNDPQWRVADMRFTPDLNADNRADFAGFGSDCVWTALSPGDNPPAVSRDAVRERVRN